MRVEGGRSTRMHLLQVGDRVLTIDDQGHAHFSDVILFFHRDVTAQAQFLKIESDSGRTLELTANHLVFVSRAEDSVTSQTFEAIFAKNVRAGDFIQIVDANATSSHAPAARVERVRRVTSLYARGLFAPLTRSGTLVVNDHVTSCYAQIESHTIAHLALAPVRLVTSLRDVVTSSFSFILQHLNLLSPRVDVTSHQHGVVSTDSSDDVTNTLTSQPLTLDGVHWYAHLLHTLAHYVIPPSLMFSET